MAGIKKQLPDTILDQGNIFFASDLHLGIPDATKSRDRELQFIKWLDEIAPQAAALYIVGDLFDFWFEYKQVVPRGFVRVLGKLAQLRDGGLPIYFFTGNHDQWMTDYFETELGIPVYHHEVQITLRGKTFLIGHGDGLGPGDHGYKFMKKIFHSKWLRWLFARLHPNFGLWLGNYWSRNNRLINGVEQETFLGEEKEWLIGYSRKILQQTPIDYFIFGHRHLALDYKLNDKSRYINLGDWIRYNSYAEFDGNQLELKYFKA